MNHLRTLLQDPELVSQVAQTQRLLFSLDFDGTLAPIVDRPDRAVLPAETKAVLRELHEMPGVTVSVVSGRSLDDVRSRVGIAGLIYSGNHGLEIEGPGIRFVHAQARALSEALRPIIDQVSAQAGGVDGVEIERKGLTVSIHYRRSSPFARRRLLEIMRASALGHDPRFIVREGKKVYEIRPSVAWNKSDAIRLIQECRLLQDALLIVAGDDSTDEDAFGAFQDAITICVAPRQKTAARHSLPTCDELRGFLAAVIDFKEQCRAI
jgi:trehalose-phosphatase